MRYWGGLVLGLCLLAAPVIASAETADSESIISELRLGALEHDAGVISSSKEEGADINAEILFHSPEFLSVIWSPRPHFGATYNLWGQTSQIYTGLTWGYDFTENIFGEFSFGPSLNNGHRDKSQDNWKDLGAPLLFRESLSLGWRFDAGNNLSLFLDHISNGGLAHYNGGMETAGLRYGIVF